MGYEVVTLRLPKYLLDSLDDLVSEFDLPNRSALIRCAIANLLLRYEDKLRDGKLGKQTLKQLLELYATQPV